jgi:hypothetical protein
MVLGDVGFLQQAAGAALKQFNEVKAARTK